MSNQFSSQLDDFKKKEESFDKLKKMNINKPSTDLKIISPKEVDKLADRLKALNDYVQNFTSDWDDLAKDVIEERKKMLEDRVNDELKKVKKQIEQSLGPVLDQVKAVIQKYLRVLQPEASLEGIITWAIDVADILFGNPYTKLIKLINDYQKPLRRLASELQRASNITVSTLSSLEDGSQLAKLNTITPTIDLATYLLEDERN